MDDYEHMLKIKKSELFAIAIVIISVILLFWYGQETEPVLPTVTPLSTVVFVTATKLPSVTPTRTLRPTFTMTPTPTSTVVPVENTPKIIVPTLTRTKTPIPTSTSTPKAMLNYMGGFTHSIVRDDNLWDLSDRFYNNGALYDAICNANNLSHDCSLIHAQNVITIPVILREIEND